MSEPYEFGVVGVLHGNREFLYPLTEYTHPQSGLLAYLVGLANESDEKDVEAIRARLDRMFKDAKRLQKPLEFLSDSLSTEMAYLINLDKQVLEVYRGYNQNPQAPGRYSRYQAKNTATYYGVELVSELSFVEARKMKEINRWCEQVALTIECREEIRKEGDDSAPQSDNPESNVNQPKPKRIYLLDASGYKYRAYFAIQHEMTNSEGFPTQAIHGFTSMMFKLLKTEQPTHMVAVYDPRDGNNLRKEIYPEYKANRKPTPDELRQQKPIIREIVDAFGIPSIEQPGYEADDTIATLATRYKQEGYEVVIVASDKDQMQLVGDGITMLDTQKGKLITPAEVEAKFGVTPDKVWQVQALCGDTSDNIPGVEGVGGGKASALINHFGNLDALLDADMKAICEVKGIGKKLAQAIVDSTEDARISYELARLRLDVPAELSVDDIAMRDRDTDKLREIFEKYELKSHINELDRTKSSGDPVPVADENTVEIFSDGACSGNPGPGGFGTILRFRGQTKELSGFDAETTNNRMELLGVITGLEALTRESKVQVVTDSSYVKDGATKWLAGWKKNDWVNSQKSPVKNRDLWMRLDALLEKHTVEIFWVRGHNGHKENERCDELAREAITNNQK